jgi:hypothetical protein
MRRLIGKWDFIAAALLAVAGAYYLPHDAVGNITTELIAFFSIQSAVILPAMIFTAGILKPDGLELEDAQRYHRALKAQMLFWVALLSLDFVAVVALIAGKALCWALHIPLPAPYKPLDLGWFFPCVLFFTGSLAVFRTIPFVRGVMSLLDLNSDMAEKSILRRNRLEIANKKRSAEITPMQLPEGYGKIVDPPSGQ